MIFSVTIFDAKLKRHAVFSLCILILSICLTSVKAIESEDPYSDVLDWVTKEDFEASGMFGNGSIKYYISNGTCKPEQEIKIQLSPRANITEKPNGILLFKLFEIQENGNLTEMARSIDSLGETLERGGVTWKQYLPYKDDSKYRLGVITIGSGANHTLIVTGRLMSTLTVPSLPWFKFNATMSTDKSHYRSTEPISITIKNYGTRISFGEPYSIEKYENGSWTKFPLNITTWIAIEYNLNTNGTFHKQLFPSHLPPGRYRVVKVVDSNALTAEFYIMGSSLIDAAILAVVLMAIIAVPSTLLLWKLKKKNRQLAQLSDK